MLAGWAKGAVSGWTSVIMQAFDVCAAGLDLAK
jgi:hypothetical protein